MAKSEVKTLRINPKTEKEIYDFVESKGGIKKALKYLYEQYTLNQKVDTIVNDLVTQLKDNIEISTHKPTETPQPTTTIKPKASNPYLNNFVK